MTDAECAETLAEFRKLTLGPRLSEALDHATGVLLARAFTPDGRIYGGFEAAGVLPYSQDLRETSARASLA